MGRTSKDRHDNEPFLLDFEEDIDVSGLYEIKSSLKRQKKAEIQAASKKRRRPAPWEDDWTDPEDDLMRGIPH